MIVRIVKMTFDPQKVNDFLSLFNASKKLIRNFNGCSHLSLLQDKNNASVFFTYSHWEDENQLNAYRDSALFADVWAKTKVLFNDRPEAWSLILHTPVE
jgi:quinol monooxygenase YgiN